MEILRKIFEIIVVVIIGYGLPYLLASFCYWDFNVFNWNFSGFTFTLCFGSILSVVLVSVLLFLYMLDKAEKEQETVQ